DGISLNRNLTKENVRRAIDDAIIRGAVAKEAGLVDHLIDEDGLRKLMQSELSEKDLKIVRDYGMTRRDAPDLSNPFALFAMLSKRPEPSNKPEIALIYADGMIVAGEGGAGMFADTVGSEEMP